MAVLRNLGSINTLLLVSFLMVLGLAFFRLHARVQMTLLGYEIGRMKEKEAALIRQRGELTMELARLTTKENLLILTEKLKTPAAPEAAKSMVSSALEAP